MDLTPPAAEILLVEDDPAIRQALCELLDDEGYRCHAVVDGQAALTYLQAAETPPCLILLDLMMPVMDGYGFRAAQQQDARLAPIPVVVLSAQYLAPEKATAMQVGFYLRKPIAVPQLLTIVDRYCS